MYLIHSKNEAMLFIEAMMRDFESNPVLIKPITIQGAPISIGVWRTIIHLYHSTPLHYVLRITIFVV